MSKRFARTLLTVPAAGFATVLTVTSAMAATTWTVRPGGAVTAKSGLVVLKDATTGSLVTCTSSAIKATLKGGTGLSGQLYLVKIGTVYAAVDPKYHWGPDVGWWLVVTMDDANGAAQADEVPVGTIK